MGDAMAQHTLLPEVREGLGRHGRVIFLNGATCSGKTTLARALQSALDGVWTRLAIDDFRLLLRNALSTKPAAEPAAVYQQMVLGFHRAAAAYALAGNDVIVDHVLGESWRLDDCLRVFSDLTVAFVGVRCALDELERRAAARGPRRVSAARLQFGLAHAHQRYDVEVDTGTRPPQACAAAVRDYLASEAVPTAFAELRGNSASTGDHEIGVQDPLTGYPA